MSEIINNHLTEFNELSLNEQKNYIKNIAFSKMKKYLLIELKNTQRIKKINLIKYIKKLENINSNIINFSNSKNEKVKCSTLPGKDILFFKKFFQNADKEGINQNMYHELRHFIGIDLLEYNNNLFNGKEYEFSSREMNTKITTVRKYMIKNNYEISIKGIIKLFSDIKNENEIINNLSPNTEIDLFAIYNNFKDKKKDLLFFLQNLVKLEDLKKEVYYA